MSTQKGNTSRTRPQKHQNKTKFKNDLHDKSRAIKMINKLEINNVCIRCKNIIEWKIKYKKYKPLKSPTTCVKCHEKNVKHAYHMMCTKCSAKLKVCPKCGQQEDLVSSTSANVKDLLKSSKVQEGVKALSERRRRTFYRHLNNSFNPQTEEEILEKLKALSVNNNEDNFDFDEYDSLGSDSDI